MSATKKEKQKTLDQIAAYIKENNVCADLAQDATNLVPGAGNPDADIVLVGEAPGKNEDLKGEPFVGAAGKFLDEMLAEIDLTRDDVFITNIIKYRPPNNRDPEPGEIKESVPYLLEQVSVIEPLLIATLGRFSMNVFMPGLKISQVHGEPKKKNGRYFLPLYHPAAALYNGSMRGVLKDDFRKIPKILKLIEEERN